MKLINPLNYLVNLIFLLNIIKKILINIVRKERRKYNLINFNMTYK